MIRLKLWDRMPSCPTHAIANRLRERGRLLYGEVLTEFEDDGRKGLIAQRSERMVEAELTCR
jgi:hypothetical protein